MKNIFYCLGVLFLLLLTSFDAHSQKKEEKLVKKAFDNYKYAILNDEGENAVQFLDSRTIQYYEKMLELVKTGD